LQKKRKKKQLIKFNYKNQKLIERKKVTNCFKDLDKVVRKENRNL